MTQDKEADGDLNFNSASSVLCGCWLYYIQKCSTLSTVNTFDQCKNILSLHNAPSTVCTTPTPFLCFVCSSLPGEDRGMGSAAFALEINLSFKYFLLSSQVARSIKGYTFFSWRELIQNPTPD